MKKTATGSWRPYPETQPEESGWYIITRKGYKQNYISYAQYSAKQEYWVEKPPYDWEDDVIAWMPAPDPYQE